MGYILAMSHAHAYDPNCPHCCENVAKIKQLDLRIQSLEAQVASLKKNSGNSSKPPSSDIIKPTPLKERRKKLKRKIGAQPGHKKQERPPLPPEQIDVIQEHQHEVCPECGGEVSQLEQPASSLQQMELVAKPVVVTEHRSRTCHCAKCDKNFTAPIPTAIQNAGLIGPHLTALTAYLKGACHCSFSTIQKYYRDVLLTDISRGMLAKLCRKVSASLRPAYEDLLQALPQENSLNIDETGHKENGNPHWTWCFRAPLFTLFTIEPSRNCQVLIDTLGMEFNGLIGCDYFGAYRKYMRLNENVQVQFCLAHLIRDVKFLTEHPQENNRAYGERVLLELRELFKKMHHPQRYRDEESFRTHLEVQGYAVWTAATENVPDTPVACNLANRFEKYGESYLKFITTPGIEPTNNVAEQAIRFVVIDRKITQGTRSEIGRQWCERIWTVMATCAQHGWNVYDFLQQSVQAFFGNTAPPQLRAI
jgi:transposase